MKTMTQAGHRVVFGDGDWYDDNTTTTTATVTMMKIMMTTVGRGTAVSVLKIEPSVAAAVGGADKQQSTKE
jgi:hypothetical protein